ncbi:helix-turn-helix transcriptional regulator [Spirillospora sp. NPDC047279]|uniref:helix-turn-helix domain-containing protein n=1 Tax=Spirillospora sp. NPDC047279 TaxID=3155478 RepID=UPI0033C2992D
MISPYVRRRRLATELRALREDAGLTHEQLARKIGEARTKLSRLENGHIAPDQNDIIKLLDVLEVDGERWTKIVTIAQEAAAKGWWESDVRAMGERQALYANLEAGAVTIREYQQTYLPGLLQIPEFTRAAAEALNSLRPERSDVRGVIKGRAGRQRMLRRPGGPTYQVIVDELAVRRPAAPPAVTRAQFEHLVRHTAESPRVSLRMLPVDALITGYSLPGSTFSVYTYADPDDPTVVALETVDADLVLTEPEQVAPYEELYQRLRDAALSEEESLNLLTQAAKELPDHTEEQ